MPDHALPRIPPAGTLQARNVSRLWLWNERASHCTITLRFAPVNGAFARKDPLDLDGFPTCHSFVVSPFASFSQSSPFCFRSAFDGILQIWFVGFVQQKASKVLIATRRWWSVVAFNDAILFDRDPRTDYGDKPLWVDSLRRTPKNGGRTFIRPPPVTGFSRLHLASRSAAQPIVDRCPGCATGITPMPDTERTAKRSGLGDAV